jgi:hypothetical protein
MCPVCITTAVLIAGSATSTGGLAAVVMKKLGVKRAVENPSEPFRENDEAGRTIPNPNEKER